MYNLINVIKTAFSDKKYNSNNSFTIQTHSTQSYNIIFIFLNEIFFLTAFIMSVITAQVL